MNARLARAADSWRWTWRRALLFGAVCWATAAAIVLVVTR